MSSTSFTSGRSAPPLPAEADLDALSRAVRRAVRDRGLPRPVGKRYEEWIFLFVAWCLRVPPFSIGRDRIGDYWTALSHHPSVGRGKLCDAMDALGFLFGHVGTDDLDFGAGADGALAGSAEDRSGNEARDDEAMAEWCPNPTLHASGTTPEQRKDTISEAWTRALPDAALPEGVNARDQVPTREDEADTADVVDGQPSEIEGSEEETVSIEVPRPVADRLQEVARRLGLPPALFAARALDLVCEDAGIERSSPADVESPLEHYQTQIDLLHFGGPEADRSEAETHSAEGTDRTQNDGFVDGDDVRDPGENKRQSPVDSPSTADAQAASHHSQAGAFLSQSDDRQPVADHDENSAVMREVMEWIEEETFADLPDA